MILAAIGDIHGNLPALDAVLGVLDDEGIQTIVNTGDIVAGHPWSNAAIERIRGRNIPSVQGELDRLTLRFERKRDSLQRRLDPEIFCQIDTAYGECVSENLEFLAGLPRVISLTIDGISVAVCHGTLNSQSTSLEKDDPETRFMRQREIEVVDIIVCGRTHEAYSREVSGTLFVNPGSVGLNSKEGLASYAIVSTETKPWQVELRTVAYSLE